MAKIQISQPSKPTSSIEIELPGSKSIANRYLILNAISGGAPFEIPYSRDCQLLQKALSNPANEYWFEDGATPARFFLAYAAAKGLQVTINGNDGLKNRSFQDLIHSLRENGAELICEEQEGYLPISIKKQMAPTGHVNINRTQSSQFVSAMLLISPLMKTPFTIQLTGNPNSDSYIRLTADCMHDFGLKTVFNGDTIEVFNDHFERPKELKVEADWSSASYFFELCAVTPKSHFLLKNLKKESKQEDAALIPYFEQLGVECTFVSEGLNIRHIGNTKLLPTFELQNNIDLAPAIICACAALQLPAKFYGIENLIYKESNRIEAINQNLTPWGATLVNKTDLWKLEYTKAELNSEIHIKTFHDHRIAMAFAAITQNKQLILDDDTCIEKSYPQFWNELRKCNFVIEDVAQ